ncbi:MAG: HupE/UreJ family protein [Capsulimonadales bacterium]|nr:HupE/UreJ family protein [Capsulimonadales bacterium]
MKTRTAFRYLLLIFALLFVSAGRAFAHEVPMTYIRVVVGRNEAVVTMYIPWSGLRHDIAGLGGPGSTASPDADAIARHRAEIERLVTERLRVRTDRGSQTVTVERTELSADGPKVEMTLSCPWRSERGEALPPPETLTLSGNLFPTASGHRMMVSFYRGETLERETILSRSEPAVTHKVGGKQTIPEVIREFVRSGIHHIFIGPDHILFVIGLLLAGGNLKTLLKVVTAFTVAHSITLALAVLEIVNLPGRVVEPTIALSIIFVGIFTLLKKEEGRDLRLPLAFAFGLIHGFGFAGALSESELPRYALGWSLFAFNIGVEVGQACIVLLVAPLLMLIARYRPSLVRPVIQFGSLAVIFFGAVWFVQRIFGE